MEIKYNVQAPPKKAFNGGAKSEEVKAIEDFLTSGNAKNMPEGLVSVAVYMAVGEYLNMKKVSGQLEGFDLEAAIKQIQEGDTNTVFAIGDGNLTPEQRLNSLIDYLTNGRSRELYRFRKFVW